MSKPSLKPIYGTDFSIPLSTTVEKVRRDISHARGQLSDISFAYNGWGERVKCVEGLLTCGLMALHQIKEEMREHEEKYGHRNVLAHGQSVNEGGKDGR